jgi:hypothetical protein
MGRAKLCPQDKQTLYAGTDMNKWIVNDSMVAGIIVLAVTSHRQGPTRGGVLPQHRRKPEDRPIIRRKK